MPYRIKSASVNRLVTGDKNASRALQGLNLSWLQFTSLPSVRPTCTCSIWALVQLCASTRWATTPLNIIINFASVTIHFRIRSHRLMRDLYLFHPRGWRRIICFIWSPVGLTFEFRSHPDQRAKLLFIKFYSKPDAVQNCHLNE